MRPALALSLLGALGACFGTQDLKLGELGSQEPPEDKAEPMPMDAGPAAEVEMPQPPSHHDDDGNEKGDDVRDAEVRLVVDAAVASLDASAVDAGALPDATRSADAGSDASDAASGHADAGDAGDAGDAAYVGDAGDAGRGSLLCMLEPWHCL